MHRFTAQLALIAYLIGGWLLPATHHHGHDHVASSAGCGCHSVSGGESGPTCAITAHAGQAAHASDQANAQTHGHDHNGCCAHHAESSDGERLLPTTGLPSACVAGDWVAGDCPSSDCAGLCALCCAVSLVGHVWLGMTTDTAPVVQVDRRMQTGLAWPLLPLSGGLSSRGPPAV